MNNISFRNPTDDSLSRAKRNVEQYYQLVGVCEEMDKFIKLVEFGLPDYFAGAHKIYGVKSKSSEILISLLLLLLYCYYIIIIIIVVINQSYYCYYHH